MEMTRPSHAAPNIQNIETREDLDRIAFVDGVAAVMVAAEALKYIRFKNAKRENSPRLKAVKESIRANGYNAHDPIIARIGQKGRWIIVDGGHRLTAARQVARELLTNLFGRKVRDIYFILFTTPRSWAKVKRLAEADRAARGLPPGPLSDEPPPLAHDDGA
jgi:hypothetical protein